MPEDNRNTSFLTASRDLVNQSGDNFKLNKFYNRWKNTLFILDSIFIFLKYDPLGKLKKMKSVIILLVIMNVFAWLVVKREQGKKTQNFENPLIISLSGTVWFEKLFDEITFKMN